MGETEEPSQISVLSKYFLHGILFSVLFLVLSFVWIVIFVGLVFIGLFIGFIIGLLVLFLFIGGINVFLTWHIWGINVASGWLNLLIHGFVLSIALFLASIPQIFINIIGVNSAITIGMFIIYCFVNGFIAKNVAGYWEEEHEETAV
jgi:hypothetical protein